tara:strand:+ start:59 stop:955 length:897 start_codon:yes stop_codon:yes gene_type:complete
MVIIKKVIQNKINKKKVYNFYKFIKLLYFRKFNQIALKKYKECDIINKHKLCNYSRDLDFTTKGLINDFNINHINDLNYIKNFMIKSIICRVLPYKNIILILKKYNNLINVNITNNTINNIYDEIEGKGAYRGSTVKTLCLKRLNHLIDQVKNIKNINDIKDIHYIINKLESYKKYKIKEPFNKINFSSYQILLDLNLIGLLNLNKVSYVGPGAIQTINDIFDNNDDIINKNDLGDKLLIIFNEINNNYPYICYLFVCRNLKFDIHSIEFLLCEFRKFSNHINPNLKYKLPIYKPRNK